METSNQFERIEVYQPPPLGGRRLVRLNTEMDNSQFRRSILTWISLSVLLILYPAMSLYQVDDMGNILNSLNQGTLMVLLISTIVVQWIIFMLLYVSTFRENTGLVGLGFKKPRWIDLAWAVAFLLGANLTLSGVAFVLAQVGMPMPGEIGMLIPTDITGKLVWVAVSITAGVCEEAAFRGYLMTRLKLLMGTGSWIVPTLVSAVAFGACHAYQGIPGFIVISIYGLLFSLLYLRTGSLWPGIIAHFFQDFGALFFPH
ncbi:MAG: type II CAAX endopeptidase family protein [bacterium]|nr:type II CAAX endopeptidase family protein [bacterium]